MNEPGWPEPSTPAEPAPAPGPQPPTTGPQPPATDPHPPATGPQPPATDPHPPATSLAVPAPVPPATRRRTGLIATLLLSALVLLCAGGGFGAYLITARFDGTGESTPGRAVNSFLRAVYVEQDAQQAAEHVCRSARDPRAIARKIREVRRTERRYRSPRYTWPEPKVDNSGRTEATVSTRVTLRTGDEKRSVQQLRFTVIKQNGWFVCEVVRAG